MVFLEEKNLGLSRVKKIAQGLLFEKLWLKYSSVGHMFYKCIQGVFAGIGWVNRFSLLQKLWLL